MLIKRDCYLDSSFGQIFQTQATLPSVHTHTLEKTLYTCYGKQDAFSNKIEDIKQFQLTSNSMKSTKLKLSHQKSLQSKKAENVLRKTQKENFP